MRWEPTATIHNLKQRASVLAKIRQFFAQRDVLEVETPLLMPATVTDPFQKAFESEGRFLQTSPEYAMKRLLAANSGCIYQIGKAFRLEEAGPYHQPEFTMLEWYRVGMNYDEMMHEVSDLLVTVLDCAPAERISYRDAFLKYLQIDPFAFSTEEFQQLAREKKLIPETWWVDADKDTWLQFFMSEFIEAQLGHVHPAIIYDYPASQAALAKTCIMDYGAVAQRFEVYIKGVELANAYHELCDANILRERFMADNQQRTRLGFPERAHDEALLAAMSYGLPDCSGVALGLDRLMMLALGAADMQEVVAFGWENESSMKHEYDFSQSQKNPFANKVS